MSLSNILVVDDEQDIRTLIEEILSDEGYGVQTAGDAAEAREQMDAGRPDLVLLDIWMPDTDGITLLKEWSKSGDLRCPVVMMSGHGSVETAMEATRLGATDFIEKPLSIAKLLRTVGNVLENEKSGRIRSGQPLLPSLLGPVGKSPQVQALRSRAQEIAPHPQPVLIIGETGSGREAMARYLHALSDRRDKPYVSVVSASITAENAPTLLLGVETPDGAEPGYLEQANGGTLFVGDLQELCAEAQALLHGALEQGSFSRLGRAQPIPANIRVIASVPPESMSDAGRGDIRADLVTRLSVLQLPVPALREYSADVPELLRHFVDRIVDTDGYSFRRFSVAAQNRLRNYPWPGNIRELEKLVQRLLIKEGPEEIGLEELEAEFARPAATDSSLIKQDLLSLPLREAREQFERAYLTEQLALCGGKVGKLAKRVGMERTHLYRKLRTLGVKFRQTGGED
jgi:two-component system nitrogen regulation response regulator NtrX